MELLGNIKNGIDEDVFQEILEKSATELSSSATDGTELPDSEMTETELSSEATGIAEVAELTDVTMTVAPNEVMVETETTGTATKNVIIFDVEVDEALLHDLPEEEDAIDTDAIEIAEFEINEFDNGPR